MRTTTLHASDHADRSRRFRLLEKVGQSTIGDVYLAEYHGAVGPELVVLKLLNGDVARLADVWQRMREEAALLVALGHPTITAPRDHVQIDNRPTIVMDLVAGADLEHVVAALELAGDRFPARAAFEVAAAVAHALDAASTSLHDGAPLGLIHRDLEPGTIRITDTGDVKLLWFGTARGTDEPEATSAGLVGAELTMAPERLLGRGDTCAGDVYGAAATLVELVLGRPLGRSPILADAHARFVEDALQQVAGQLGGSRTVVSRATDVLRSALDARPDARPSARELGAVLEDIARELDGEGLRMFAERFLPTIDRVLARMRTPVTGAVADRVARPADTPRILPPAPGPVTSHDRGSATRTGSAVRTFAWLASTAALSTLCGAGAMFGLVRIHSAIDPESTTAMLTVLSRPAPAMLVVRDAASVRVQCGAFAAEGADTVRLGSLAVGTCSVVATDAAGRTARGAIEVDATRRVGCEIDGSALRCGPLR